MEPRYYNRPELLISKKNKHITYLTFTSVPPITVPSRNVLDG